MLIIEHTLFIEKYDYSNYIFTHSFYGYLNVRRNVITSEKCNSKLYENWHVVNAIYDSLYDPSINGCIIMNESGNLSFIPKALYNAYAYIRRCLWCFHGLNPEIRGEDIEKKFYGLSTNMPSNVFDVDNLDYKMFKVLKKMVIEQREQVIVVVDEDYNYSWKKAIIFEPNDSLGLTQKKLLYILNRIQSENILRPYKERVYGYIDRKNGPVILENSHNIDYMRAMECKLEEISL